MMAGIRGISTKVYGIILLDEKTGLVVGVIKLVPAPSLSIRVIAIIFSLVSALAASMNQLMAAKHGTAVTKAY